MTQETQPGTGMAYEGNSLDEAWEFWFDEAPSEDVRKVLAARLRQHSLDDVLDALRITSTKPQIIDQTNRLKYMSGVLRKKALI
jgi:hypothetical protein